MFHIRDIVLDVKRDVVESEVDSVDVRLAARLAGLRAERGWSLGELAERSGVSKSTLSRAERAEISPTAALLNRLCGVYGRTMSQLLSEVEAEPAPLVVWLTVTSGVPQLSDGGCGGSGFPFSSRTVPLVACDG